MAYIELDNTAVSPSYDMEHVRYFKVVWYVHFDTISKQMAGKGSPIHKWHNSSVYKCVIITYSHKCVCILWL